MNSPLHTKRIASLVILLTMMATALYWWQLSRSGSQLRSETIAQAELRARQLNSAVAEQVAILVRYADFAAQELADTYALGKTRVFALQADKVKHDGCANAQEA